MGHKKLIKFAAIASFPNVLQFPEAIKGNWHTHFNNQHPIVLELACGKGEYSVGLGRQHPENNYIGIDIKGNRQYTGAKIALAEGLTNVAFLRTHIGQIDQYFAPGEVSEIWIVFVKKGKEKNRLTHERFLHLYQKIAQPNAIIHLKTDSPVLYEFTLATIAEQQCRLINNIPDIYAQSHIPPALHIQTYYESLHLAEGRTIYYVSFMLPESEIKLTGRFNKTTEPTHDRI